MPINELRSITIFAKVAELGSLRKAAEAQDMTPQAASQALAQLEQHLGVRLFHRTTRSMKLTDAGRQFLETAVPALTSLQHALATTRRTTEEIAGPLRIVGPAFRLRARVLAAAGRVLPPLPRGAARCGTGRPHRQLGRGPG